MNKIQIDSRSKNDALSSDKKFLFRKLTLPNLVIAEFAFLRNPFLCIPVEHSCLKTGMTQFLRNNGLQELQFWQGPLPKIIPPESTGIHRNDRIPAGICGA